MKNCRTSSFIFKRHEFSCTSPLFLVGHNNNDHDDDNEMINDDDNNDDNDDNNDDNDDNNDDSDKVRGKIIVSLVLFKLTKTFF